MKILCLQMKYISCIVTTIVTLILFYPSQVKSAESLIAPKDFNVYVEVDIYKGTSILDVGKNEQIKKYNYDIVVKGEKLKQKIFAVNFTENEKRLLWEYIVRNQILSIKPGDYKSGVNMVYYPRIYHVFKITNNGMTYEYKIEALHKITNGEIINKFWGLYKILELMLNSRRLSFKHELWIVDDLRERIKKMDAGEPLPFAADQLPFPFKSILKKPERLKKFIETWDRFPISPISLSRNKSVHQDSNNKSNEENSE